MNFLYKKRKAQQLIEFAIVVPILIMVLFIVVEVGNALNARLTLAEGVKTAIMKVNRLNNLDGDQATKINTVRDFIRNEVTAYLIQHNIPNSASVDISVRATDDYAVLYASYDYNMIFLVEGLFGGAIPGTIPFSSTQNVNPHVFKDNVLPTGGLMFRTTEQLGNYHTDAGMNPIETGALIDGDIHGDGLYDVRKYTAFLLHFYDGVGTHPNLEYDRARLVSWEGHDLLPPNLRVNVKTGTLEVRSPYYNNGVWFDTRIPYIWVVSSLGINHLIFVKYNSFEMLLADDSTLYYKLRFNSDDPFYNRGISFCGTTLDSGDCFIGADRNQSGRATVNERALRMNPRLGVGPGFFGTNWNNDHIVGSKEPVYIPDDPTHHHGFINGLYFSYSPHYAGWTPSSWGSRFLVTIASPHVLGLQAGVDDMNAQVYHVDISDDTKNPFYRPYQYRLRIGECNNTIGPQGGFWSWSPADPAGTDDGNIDANISSGWDDVETATEHHYVIDIADVYTDSDGDGIPDAWDRDPAHPDVNLSGILDGNELNSVVFNTNNRCNDGIGNPLMYEADTWAHCIDFPNFVHVGDVIGAHTVVAGDFTEYRPSPGKHFYKATPYTIMGVIKPNEPNTLLPEIEEMPLVIYDPPTSARSAIYYDRGVAVNPRYTRIHPNWWGQITATPNPVGSFHLDNVAQRKQLKVNNNFIYGSYSAPNINIDRSDELHYLRHHVFHTNSTVTRTHPSLW